jgi:glycosyltransferase involved in cell wall biosynthesis
MAMSADVLLYDASATGHHGEFLENLICGLSTADSERSRILSHPDLKERLNACRQSVCSKIRLDFLTAEEVDYLQSAKGIVQIGSRQLEVLDRYIDENVTRVVLMHMNLHQYALHTWRLPPDVEIAGILLNPYTPRSRAFGLRAQLFALLTGIRKRIQFTLLLRNQAISRIFLLNDEPMAKQLNRWYSRRPVFDSIPDPLPSRSPFIESKLKDDHVRPFTFLLAGSLAPRKGCLETLEAIAHASKRLARPLRLRIMGRFRDEASAYRDRVMCALHRLQVELAPSHMRVEIEDGFIDNKSLSRAFAESDCVLAPYLEFYGSSGMIGHACRYQKPLLACRDGLLGELVREKKLGLCVNPRNREEFAKAIIKIVNGDYEYDVSMAESYVSEARAQYFAKKLLK